MREVRRWKRKENILPTTPQIRTGFEIPLVFQKVEDGRPFLQYNIGINDPERMLIFATKEVLEDSTTVGSWACDGTFKCSHLVFGATLEHL